MASSLYSKGEGDMLPNAYLENETLSSYNSSSENANNSKVHVNMNMNIQPPLLSYQNSMQLSRDQSMGINRDEMVFIPPTSSVSRQIDMQLMSNSDSSHVLNINEPMHNNNSQHFPQYHALSLSLGSQEPSLVQLMHSDLRPYTDSNLDMQSGVELAQDNNVEYTWFDSTTGKSRDSTVQYGAGTSGFDNLISSKETYFVPCIQQGQEQIHVGRWCNSTYLKAAQDLLDELVNVHRAPYNKPMEKVHKIKELGHFSAELQESNNINGSRRLPPSDCQTDLQNKHMKLVGMLEEVERRMKKYEQEMQAVVSSFEMVAGRGAAQAYTLLPLQTISRQFRCVRDAIKKQIQAINPNSVGVLSRLRYVDQHLRQQRALHQFGVVRQPWRPQRGLPETAVSVLRAWLFEHFLHPYPTESEKMVLAREAGLTRSQVANWFINARVRLWKPMIEEIYKEEFGDAETESRHETTTVQQISAASDENERKEDFEGMRLRSISATDEIQSKGNDDESSSSMLLDKLDYYYMGQPNKFSSTNLLSDFVT